VTFNASVSDVLPWKFVPQQREVRVLPGETALAFYTATNKSDQDIIGVATYSVTPGQVAPYFSKIQCFCFEEQRLNAGETVDMPVFFYLDPDMLNDMNTKGIETVTLSYTFFSEKFGRPGSYLDINKLTPSQKQNTTTMATSKLSRRAKKSQEASSCLSAPLAA
jgi:cytochrome c oxidase assembly protein Cox11